jgi:uncharacterized protein (TIGR02301 family)
MRRPGLSRSRRGAALLGALAALAIAVAAAATGPATNPAWAQGTSSDTKPYDDKLMRLSEILGAVHYLRELCGSSDGQKWRDQMRELMDTEGSSALRRAKLTRSFNNGYRSYSRTYNVCSQSAQTAITRFLADGADIAESLAKTAP